jgi:hypothetical protein
MKKIASQNIVVMITLTVMLYAVYTLLLQDNFLNTSISSIISRSHHLEPRIHLIVLGLLPIYIATVIFGSAMLGMYIGSWITQAMMRGIKKPIVVQKKLS